jgi:hypothetical protein
MIECTKLRRAMYRASGSSDTPVCVGVLCAVAALDRAECPALGSHNTDLMLLIQLPAITDEAFST